MAKGNRKNIKRKESKRIEMASDFETDIFNKMFVALGVILFLLAFYLLTLHIVNKNTNQNTEEESSEVSISNDKIILGRSLSMSDSEYLVIYYDTTNEEESKVCSELFTKYKSDGSIPIYYVDMSSAFNKAYITDGEVNRNPKNESELLINGSTLIKVVNKEVVDYIQGQENISNYLG